MAKANTRVIQAGGRLRIGPGIGAEEFFNRLPYYLPHPSDLDE
jgi:hypothetical protein